jgi:hypothetical protein
MKQILVLICVLLITCNIAFSEENTLIDFTLLEKNFPANAEIQHNRETTMPFGDQVGAGYTKEQKDKMIVSMALDEWRVELASSSQTVARMSKSFCVEAQTGPNADPYNGEEMKSRTILGVRILFPESTFNSYAIIKPPFEVQAYQDKITWNDDLSHEVQENDIGAGEMFDGIGVLKNVGDIKKIATTVYGANYPHGLEIILQNEMYEQHSYHMGYLDYEGWNTLEWENPNYIESVKNRTLKKYPLYPREEPYQKFIGYIVYRDANTLGGDFIVYFKDVVLTYDQAIRKTESPQIEDEKIWHILADRTESRRDAEYKRLGARQLLETIEREKMHPAEE